MPLVPYLLRHMTETDKSFIYNSFLVSLFKHSEYSKIPQSIYYKQQSQVINSLFQHAKVLIACFPEDPDTIMGYVIYELFHNHLILHWLYVKRMFRHRKLAREMLSSVLPEGQTAVICTHVPYYFHTLTKKVPHLHFSFDPIFIANRPILEAK